MKGSGAGEKLGICGSCGADDWTVERRGVAERAWSWFNSGRGSAAAERAACRRCGRNATTFRVTLRLDGRHWWRAPWRAYLALQGARTAHPVPRTYLAAAAVGAGLGAGLCVVYDWSWWLVGVGAGVGLVATSLAFLSTFDRSLSPYLIRKGSIAVDGISLTVATLGGSTFDVMIIPFTWSHTALSSLTVRDLVNIECDMIGKYVARSLELSEGVGRLKPAPTT